MISENFEDLFSSLKGTSFDGTLDLYFDLLKILPTGIDKNVFDKINSKHQVFKEAFQQTSINNSFYNLLNDTYKLVSQYTTNPRTYRSLRNTSLEELKLTHDYTKSRNPIEDISKNLELSTIKKTFKELAEQNLKGYLKEKDPSRFDIFVNHYILLDYLGYYRDSHFKNLLQDAFHAYYGAHCDFFVTDDDNTYHKAKVIYEHFNIETVVCKSHEFNTQLFGKVVLNKYFEKPFFEVISEVLSSSFVISNQHDDKFNPVDIYKIEHYILGYFNRLQITYGITTNSTSIFIYKNSKNYSSFSFFAEIETVTNKIIKELGIDKNNRLDYVPEIENEEIMKNDWTGRIWQMTNALIQLQMQEAPFGLTLAINY